MAKRSRLEIIRDILTIISNNHSSIKKTPLIRKSNLSTSRFNEYFSEILRKDFAKEINIKNEKLLEITDKGIRFLEKYKTLVAFIDEFDL